MPRATETKKMFCVIRDAEADGSRLVVRLTPVRGNPPEICDRICMGPERDLQTVNGVGRFLRQALAVHRRGGHSALRIPRDSLIRYESATLASLEVVSVLPQ